MDLASLAESIKSGRVAGAAVDVYPTEPETNSDGFQTGACLPGASKSRTCRASHPSVASSALMAPSTWSAVETCC